MKLPAIIFRHFEVPFLEKFGRWLFSWRSVRAAVFGTLVVLTLIAMFYVVENWRGRYAWKKYRAAAEARGVQFDFRACIPPPVPDEQNLAMTPLLVPLFEYEPGKWPVVWRDTNGWNRVHRVRANRDGFNSVTLGDWTRGDRIKLEAWQDTYRGESNDGKKRTAQSLENNFPVAATKQSAAADVLLALTKFAAEMREIEAAARRPHSRFPIHYDEGSLTLLAHLSVMQGLSSLFQLRAAALLAQTNHEAAFTDLQTVLHLSDATKDEPLLISQVVRQRLLHRAMQTLWEGMSDHRWTDAQLALVQRHLAVVDPVADFSWALRREPAFQNLSTIRILQDRDGFLRSWAKMMVPGEMRLDIFSFYVRFAPSGWFYRNEIARDQRIEEALAALSKGKASGVFVPAEFRPGDRTKLYEMIVEFPGSFFSNCVSQIPQSQVRLKLAETACALERFHLANRAYPQTLAELTPQFLATIPSDFMDGQPLRYRRLDDHKFVLYSVGLDRNDDGGKLPAKENEEASDWVWQIR